MSEADILATTYKDKYTNYRKTGAVKDPVTKQSRQETVMVAEDIPCALSSPTGGGVNFSGGFGSYQKGYTLFCRPEADIKAGDKLIVVTQAGCTFTLWAGRPFAYAGSHMETPLSEDERT